MQLRDVNSNAKTKKLPFSRLPMPDVNKRLAIYHNYCCYTDTHFTLMKTASRTNEFRIKEFWKKWKTASIQLVILYTKTKKVLTFSFLTASQNSEFEENNFNYSAYFVVVAKYKSNFCCRQQQWTAMLNSILRAKLNWTHT